MAGSALRHPLRAAGRDAEHLREIVEEGTSEATPLILVGIWVVVAALLVAVVVTLALVAAHVLAH